jgi:DNA-binding transcriptional ArsR family regulator
MSSLWTDGWPRFDYHRSMEVVTAESRFAEIAAAFADRARARMLSSLLDGRERTATDLASIAQVAGSTASSHLPRLERAGLVECRPAGKLRFYRLGGEVVAAAVESLFRLVGEPRSPTLVRVPARLRHARTCYDHAAGEFGVAIHDRLRELEWIVVDEAGYDVTDSGAQGLRAWRIDCHALRALRRSLVRPCLDWSERMPHVGGALGATLLNQMLEQRWVERHPDSRALKVTVHGQQVLSTIGLAWAADAQVRSSPAATR